MSAMFVGLKGGLVITIYPTVAVGLHLHVADELSSAQLSTSSRQRSERTNKRAQLLNLDLAQS